MLRPVLRRAAIRGVVRVEGGLVNTLYRLTVDPGETTLVLRIAPHCSAAFQAEAELLPRLPALLPVPQLLWVDRSGKHYGHPYMVYHGIQWCDAETSFAGVLFRVAG
jgi:aminoglycoside phosphotransferase (APT) family kinase protein